MFAGKKSAQIREILISESAWEEMTCLFAPSLRDQDLDNGSLYGGAARHGTRQPALCPADGFDSMRDHVVIVTAIAAAPRDVVYQSVS